MQLEYSFIIPVFNRPNEIKELLESFANLEFTDSFEIIIVEDGSTEPSVDVVNSFKSTLNIVYLVKPNSGPGDSRNFGMKHTSGNYFIILDSDCILPKNYLFEVNKSLQSEFVDCYGGPDAAKNSFSNLQKAINFAMTSFLTTGGIRGGRRSIDKFQPRSFNMGISKEAFLATNGFGNIHPGEDPDLSIRLWKLNFKTKLIPEAFVYHKRRISWGKFYKQVNKFGKVRPILNLWHPETKKVTYWFPFLFVFGLLISIILLVFYNWFWPILLYGFYVTLVFLVSLWKTKSILVAWYAIIAVLLQFMGYGFGFIESVFAINVLKKDPKEHFPELFFKS